MFHASLGRELGLNLERGLRREIFGISEGKGIVVYLHEVKVQVIGDSTPLMIEVGFTESKNVSGLLGQTGFFDRYHVKFERNKERIELTTAN